MKQKSDAELLLEQWGRWIRSHQLGGNCSPLYFLMRDNLGGVVPDISLTDDVALRVDSIVCTLRQRSVAEYNAIFYRYGLALPDYRAQQKLRCGRTQYSFLLRSGLCWLEGFLQGLEAA